MRRKSGRGSQTCSGTCTCSGTGTWRRNPDAKWRVRPGSLAMRIAQQATVLDRAATLVRPGGRIVYVTCSLLADENADQVAAFLTRHPGFAAAPPADRRRPVGYRKDPGQRTRRAR